MTKLKWGMIGGGEGSQIGPAHRMGAMALTANSTLSAGALDHRPEAGRDLWQAAGHRARPCLWRLARDAGPARKTPDDRIDLVTVATPNATHYEITKAYLEAGFHVLCEKPMTMTVEEGEDIVRTARATAKICAVNYGYTGYPLVRHMKAMVARGISAPSAWSRPISPMATTPMRLMPTIRGCAGATIRPRPASRRNSPIAASTRCTWRASSPARKWKNCRPIFLHFGRELEDDAMVNFRMNKGPSGGSGPRRSPLAASTG
jgi:hypothetical protein